MSNSKLVQLLRTLSKEEFKSFGKFVRSPFFYKDKAVIKLYDSLKTCYPDFSNEKLSKKLLFNKMYPKKQYSDSHMKYLMSELLSLTKRYLSYRSFENDKFEMNLRLLKELNLRNSGKIFESSLKVFEAEAEKIQIRNEAYFHKMFRLKEVVSDYYSYKNRLSEKIEHGKIIENIVNHFLISLLNSYYVISSNVSQYQLNIDLRLIKYIEEFMKINSDIINPVVHIYYNLFMLSYLKEETYYKNLQELKGKYLHVLDDDGRHRIFESLGNYCIDSYQRGGIKYYKDAFILIKDEIKFGVRFNRNEFSEIFFTNKVEIASKLKEFNWAYEFIENYKNRLNKEHKDDIVNFCYAIIEFENNNYTASIDRLSKINLHHPLLRFRIRNYTLLNYYELNYFEQSYLFVEAYRRMLLKDKKVETGRKERYFIFLHLYQKLLDLKTGSSKIETYILNKEIESKSVFMKQWLLEKVSQL